MRRTLVVWVVTLSMLLIVTGIALAGSGTPVYRGCISAETESTPPCGATAGASVGGHNSGLDFPQDGVISADGKSVYVSAADDAAVARFKRSAKGKLTYRGCLTGETQAAAAPKCEAIPSASSGGTDSGLDFVASLALSTDGKSLYAASPSDSAIARFTRNRKTGALTYKGCVTGEIASGSSMSGSGACNSLSTENVSGAGSGLYEPSALAISRDGKSLYAAAQGDDAVMTFKRSTKTGAIASKGCLTGNAQLGPAGLDVCDLTPGAQSNGQNSGIRSPLSLAVSGDGISLYATSQEDAAVMWFRRDPKGGALTAKGCITGETQTAAAAGCDAIPSATSGGTASGLSAPYAAVITRDGRSVYVTAASDSAFDRFKRNRKSGAISYRDCITGDTAAGPTGTDACAEVPAAAAGAINSGMYSATALVASRDLKSVYVAANFDNAVARFARNRKTGALNFKGCISGDTETGPSGSGACVVTQDATPGGGDSGMNSDRAIFASPGDRSLYVVAAFDDAVSRFSLPH